MTNAYRPGPISSRPADSSGIAVAEITAPNTQGLSVILLVNAADDPSASFEIKTGASGGLGALEGEAFGPVTAWPGETIQILGHGLIAGHTFAVIARGSTFERGESPPPEVLTSGVVRSQTDVAAVVNGRTRTITTLVTPSSNQQVLVLGAYGGISNNAENSGGPAGGITIDVRLIDQDASTVVLVVFSPFVPTAKPASIMAGSSASPWIPLGAGKELDPGHRLAVEASPNITDGQTFVSVAYQLRVA